jgi:hypothetical protein
METNWRTIRNELVELLAAPEARRCFDDLKADVAALRPWSAARLVASFLSRRTPRLEHRKAVLRALLSVVVEGGQRAEVAAAILLLAGALAVPRLRRHKQGGPAPAMPFVLIVGAPLATTAAERPLAASIMIPSLSQERRLAIQGVAR